MSTTAAEALPAAHSPCKGAVEGSSPSGGSSRCIMPSIRSDDWIEVHTTTLKIDDEGHAYVLLTFSATEPLTAYCDALKYSVHKYLPQVLAEAA